MKPYKVLLVSAEIPPAYSGTGLQWYRYARRLQRRGELAYLLTFDAPGELCVGFRGDVDEKKVIRVPRCKVPGRADSLVEKTAKLWWMWTLFLRVGWVLWRRRSEYEVVHVTSSSWVCVFAILWARACGKVAIYETSLAHFDDLSTLRQATRLGYWMIRRADAVLAISPQLYELCEGCGGGVGRLYLINNPRDTDIFKPVDGSARVALRRKLGLPSQGPVILFVGAMIDRKGVDLLPAIFRKVLDKLPDACLVLVGPETPELMKDRDSTAAEFVRRELRDCLVNRQLFFVGNVWAVHEYMQASDVFLFPSRNEGLPNAPIEAMACGVPCVVRDIEGVSAAYVEDGVDGVIVDGENPAHYAEALVLLLTDHSKRRQMGLRAREKVLSRWSSDSGDERYREIYQKQMNRRDPRKRDSGY